ncbi:MAG: hypothetical protein ABIH00_11420 [Armatimonadota bacterium]
MINPDNIGRISRNTSLGKTGDGLAYNFPKDYIKQRKDELAGLVNRGSTLEEKRQLAIEQHARYDKLLKQAMDKESKLNLEIIHLNKGIYTAKQIGKAINVAEGQTHFNKLLNDKVYKNYIPTGLTIKDNFYINGKFISKAKVKEMIRIFMQKDVNEKTGALEETRQNINFYREMKEQCISLYSDPVSPANVPDAYDKDIDDGIEEVKTELKAVSKKLSNSKEIKAVVNEFLSRAGKISNNSSCSWDTSFDNYYIRYDLGKVGNKYSLTKVRFNKAKNEIITYETAPVSNKELEKLYNEQTGTKEKEETPTVAGAKEKLFTPETKAEEKPASNEGYFEVGENAGDRYTILDSDDPDEVTGITYAVDKEIDPDTGLPTGEEHTIIVQKIKGEWYDVPNDEGIGELEEERKEAEKAERMSAYYRRSLAKAGNEKTAEQKIFAKYITLKDAFDFGVYTIDMPKEKAEIRLEMEENVLVATKINNRNEVLEKTEYLSEGDKYKYTLTEKDAKSEKETAMVIRYDSYYKKNWARTLKEDATIEASNKKWSEYYQNSVNNPAEHQKDYYEYKALYEAYNAKMGTLLLSDTVALEITADNEKLIATKVDRKTGKIIEKNKFSVENNKVVKTKI